MPTKTKTDGNLLLFQRWITSIVTVVFVLSQHVVGTHVALAASTWNPTMIVNTESFQIVDEGDATSNIEFRFGQNLNEKLLYDRTNNRFVFSRSLKIAGTLTTTGAAIINVSNTTATPDTGLALEVIGTASGRIIHAQDQLRSSGSLNVATDTNINIASVYGRNTGFSSTLLNLQTNEEDTGTFNFFTLKTDVDGTPLTKLTIDQDAEFLFADTNAIFSSNGQAIMNIDANNGGTGEYFAVKKNGTGIGGTFGFVVQDAGNSTKVGVNVDPNIGSQLVVSGSAVIGRNILGVTTADSTLALEVIGNASGTNLFATRSVSGAHLYASTTFGGAGLSNCTGAGNKLTWLASTKQFACEVDQTGGGSSFGSGNVVTLTQNRFVEVQGDTMTGGLLIQNSTTHGVLPTIENGVLLEVAGVASGRIIHARNTLQSSGSLVIRNVAGTNTGVLLNVDMGNFVYDGSNRRVGIGTTTPRQPITVYRAADDSALQFKVGTSTQINGPNNPGTTTSDNSIGTVPWTNTDNATAQDDTYAGAVIGDSTTTEYLKVTNFGFTIPAGAIITGITAEVDRYAESNGCTYADAAIRIVKGGTIGTNDRSRAGNWSTSDTDTYVSYGSSSDLWGQAWTPSDINASTFGVAVSAVGSGLCVVVVDTVHVDHIRMTVSYILTRDWTIGADFSDNGKFKLTASGALGVPDYLTVTATGSFGFGRANTNPSKGFSFSGAVLINPNGNVGIARADAGLGAEIIGTASGLNFFATKSISGAHLYASSTFAGAGLSDCDTGATSKLLWDAATKTFSCGTDQTGGGSSAFGTGNVITIGDSRYVNTSGDTMTGGLLIKNGSPTATIDAGLLLEVAGTASGRDVMAQYALRSSGTLVVDGDSIFEGALTFGDSLADTVRVNASVWTIVNDTNFVLIGGVNGLSFDTDTFSVDATADRIGIGTTAPKTKLEVMGTASGINLYAGNAMSGTHLYASTTFGGAGLSNCTGAGNKLTWLSSTKQFACEADQTGGGSSAFGTGNVITIGDSRYVNTSGDTMTGALTINMNGAGGNGTGLVLRERAYFGSGATLSGSLVLAKRAIPGKTSTGTLGIFGREVAGRTMLHAIDSSGFEYPMQPGLDRSVFLIAPAATTTVTAYGATTTNSATLSHPTPTEALPYATNFATSTTSGNESGLISVNTLSFRGSAAGFNGFYYHARIIVIDTAAMIAFTGLTSATSLANVFGGTSDPAGHHAGFQFSTLRADTNWQFITKDNVTLNVVNTGMAFTANNVYDLYMFVNPQGSTMYWRVDNRTAGTSAEGYTGSNLPGATTALRIATGVETQAAVAKSIRSSRMYLEASR